MFDREVTAPDAHSLNSYTLAYACSKMHSMNGGVVWLFFIWFALMIARRKFKQYVVHKAIIIMINFIVSILLKYGGINTRREWDGECRSDGHQCKHCESSAYTHNASPSAATTRTRHCDYYLLLSVLHRTRSTRSLSMWMDDNPAHRSHYNAIVLNGLIVLFPFIIEFD